MREYIDDEPLTLERFIELEQEQLSISMSQDLEELRAVSHIQALYSAALSKITLRAKADLIVFQLLGFTHYHFLFGTACLLRCHLSEAFSSLRVAIDAALVAAYIIQDRPSQEAYFARTKPFDKLIRHAKNFIRDNRPEKLPHPMIPNLIDMHDVCSQFASHADIETFTHRRREFRDNDGISWATTEYFQFSRDPKIQRYYFFSLMHGYAMLLDIFALFLIDEQEKVPQQWRLDLHKIVAGIEQLRGKLEPKEEEPSSPGDLAGGD
ncbi:hypothetical protein [Acidisoma cladoniae]|uniref:hypothetical protein n=1 Tax=Acidisoma cladoniae TaxID=3040935 RepID=UPI00254BC963|nr:hypothetical protein [Acidisoma sp. PAMC 29798]